MVLIALIYSWHILRKELRVCKFSGKQAPHLYLYWKIYSRLSHITLFQNGTMFLELNLIDN